MSTEEPPPANASAVRRYWAFISYSHADAAWGEWLHRSLERYHVPRSLVGKPSRDGPIPRQLVPIFRDRDELPVSDDLGANLKNALARSAYLIVICSPSSARSRWVDEEIRTFKTAKGEARLLCLVTEGEPNAGDKPGAAPERECFPEAVRYRVGEEGRLTDVRVEPIAADARLHADGRARAKLKIVAGMLGVNFDDLWQRERRRRLRNRMAGGLALCGAIALAVIGHQWERQRSEIHREIALGEGQLHEMHRLEAARHFAAAWKAGGRDDRLEADLRESAKGLVEPVAILKGGHTQWVTFAAFVGNDRVVTTSWDETVRLWDVNALSSQLIARERAKVSNAAFAPDSKAFALALWNGALRLYRTAGAGPLDLLSGGQRLNWVAFSADGGRLVCGGDDAVARVFAITGAGAAAPGAILEIRGHDDYVKSAEFSPDGKSILTASFDTTAKIWDARTGQRLRTLVPHPAAVNAAVFSPDGRSVATACLDGTAVIWDLTAPARGPQKILRLIPVHPGFRVNRVAFSPDGLRLATACDDHTAKIWDVSTGRLLLSYEGHKDLVACVAFSPDGTKLVTASKDGVATVVPAEPKRLGVEEIVRLAEKLAPPEAGEN